MSERSAIDVARSWDHLVDDDATLDLLRAVLEQARAQPTIDPTTVGPDDAWRERFAARHRVGGLVHRGWPTVESRERLEVVTRRQLHLDHVSRTMVAALGDAGIDTRVLKGLATAELDYVEPWLREGGDVDLLVRSDDLTPTVALLEERGGTTIRRVATRFEHMQGATVVVDGVEIDVHFRLSRYLPIPDHDAVDALWSEPEPLPGGRSALSVEGRLVHAGVHAVLSVGGGRRLSTLADLVVLADRFDAEPWRWERARSLAAGLGAAGVVGDALRMEATITGRSLEEAARWPALDRLVARAFDDGRHVAALSQLVALRALPTLHDRIDYVRAWLAPDAEVAAARGGRAAYLGRLVVRAAGRPIDRDDNVAR